MKIYIPTILAIFFSVYAFAGTALKDPRTRNEDISNTEIIVDYQKDLNGNYVYTYSVITRDENLGRIRSFAVNISCEVKPEFPDFDSGQYNAPDSTDSSINDFHVPAVVNAPYGEAALFGISVSNTVSWGVFLDPGKSRQGLTIISPAKPGSRQYKLLPSMDNSKEWDYSSYHENDPTVPWIDDFTVYGTTIGPACPGAEQKEPRFMGTRMPDETDADNALLTYSKPLDDHIDYQVGVGQIAITIHYADTIDPESFTVNPGSVTIPPHSDPLRDLFHPQPGTSETVNVPIVEELKLELRVRGVSNSISGKQIVERKNSSPSVDNDIFYIRE